MIKQPIVTHNNKPIGVVKSMSYNEHTPEGIIKWTFTYDAGGRLTTTHKMVNYKKKVFIFR